MHLRMFISGTCTKTYTYNKMNLLCFGYIFSCQKIIKNEFEDIDTDHDGRISIVEYQKHFLTAFGRSPTNDEWMKFHMSDSNNDGHVSNYDIVRFSEVSVLRPSSA